MKRIVFIITTFITVALLVVFVRYISKVAPTHTSVIKQYSYKGDLMDIIAKIQTFCAADSNLIAKITDTTGTPDTGYDYYLDIEVKKGGRDILYGIVCNKSEAIDISGSTIKLVMAYDKINNTGGYNINAAAVKQLSDLFEINFIVPLQNFHQIRLSPVTNP